MAGAAAEDGVPGASGGPYTNRTLAGDLNVVIEEGVIWMDMAAPEYIRAIDDADELEGLYAVMGLNAPPGRSCQGAADSLPEVISTGLPDIILPVATEERLNAINADFPSLAELSKRYDVTGVHAFCPSGATYRCRNFAPLYGIDEEAATGTANAALTYYLYRHGAVTTGATNVFIQGEAMGRPSRILTRLTSKEVQAHTPAHGNNYGNSPAPGNDRGNSPEAGEAGAVRVKAGGVAVILASGDIKL
jgi:PhzF family phenazine biosynthesis protein